MPDMTEKERLIIKSITAAMPNMSEFYKGYILGVAETKVVNRKMEAASAAGAADPERQAAGEGR